MNKIIINSFEQSDLQLKVSLQIDGNHEELIVNINEACLPYLTIDRADAIIVGLLYFAMKNGYDFESRLPMTQGLWYNIVYHFMPALSLGNPHLHVPEIKCPFVPDADISQKKFNATGISCGVDSLYTIATNTTDDIPAENRLNALCFFNVGAGMKGDETLRTPLMAGRLKLAEGFAKDYGYPLFFIESNIHILINKYGRYSHIEQHEYMGLFCILLIQKGIKQYHYSSGYSVLDFNICNKNNEELDTAHYEILFSGLITTLGTSLYSEGADKSRREKVETLVKWEPSYKYLNVCVDEPCNCGKCFKCIRTMLEIDAVGDINNYKDVFDVESYKKNRNYYLRRLYIDAKFKHNSHMAEIYPYFEKEITFSFKAWCLWSVIKNRILRKREIV